MLSLEMIYHNISLKMISIEISTRRILEIIRSMHYVTINYSIGVASFSIEGETKLV